MIIISMSDHYLPFSAFWPEGIITSLPIIENLLTYFSQNGPLLSGVTTDWQVRAVEKIVDRRRQLICILIFICLLLLWSVQIYIAISKTQISNLPMKIPNQFSPHILRVQEVPYFVQKHLLQSNIQVSPIFLGPRTWSRHLESPPEVSQNFCGLSQELS